MTQKEPILLDNGHANVGGARRIHETLDLVSLLTLFQRQDSRAAQLSAEIICQSSCFSSARTAGNAQNESGHAYVVETLTTCCMPGLMLELKTINVVKMCFKADVKRSTGAPNCAQLALQTLNYVPM